MAQDVPSSTSCNCALLRQAARRATALYDTAMAPYGLRISQYALLGRLQRNGPSSLRALAAGMGLDRTTLGRNLRPLERDGLVAAAPDAGDRRVRRLEITPAGRERLAAARPAWQDAQRRFEAQFGAERSAALRTTLQDLSTRLSHADAAADPA
jgi:DNA-binding MarR family transcriptional regulator